MFTTITEGGRPWHPFQQKTLRAKRQAIEAHRHRTLGTTLPGYCDEHPLNGRQRMRPGCMVRSSFDQVDLVAESCNCLSENLGATLPTPLERASAWLGRQRLISGRSLATEYSFLCSSDWKNESLGKSAENNE